MSTSSTIDELRADIAELREQLEEKEAELLRWRQSGKPIQQRPNDRILRHANLSKQAQLVTQQWSMLVWHGATHAEILPNDPTHRPQLLEKLRELNKQEECRQWTHEIKDEDLSEELFVFLDIDGDGEISAEDFAQAIIRPLVLEQLRSLVAGFYPENMIAELLLQPDANSPLDMPGQAAQASNQKPARTDSSLLQAVQELARSSHQQIRARLRGLEEVVATAVHSAAAAFGPSFQLAQTQPGSDSKFASGLKYRFGALDDFKAGLQTYLGLPDRDVAKAMEHEHVSDRRGLFRAKNYGTETDPPTEWQFVNSPHTRSDAFPGEAHGGKAGRARRSVEEVMGEAEVQAAGLSREEVLAVRLYTGPMFQIYNEVLRKRPPERPYRNTLLMLISATMKMAWTMEVPATRKVYRGLQGGELPPAFLLEDSHGCRGGVEWVSVGAGFMSTSLDKEMAASYAGRGSLPILLEMEVGAVDRGAPIGCISQYAAEREVLFPPMSNLEVYGSPRVDMAGGKPMMVLQVRVSMNLRHKTREELAGERKHIFTATLRNTLQEVAAEMEAITREEAPANPFLLQHEGFAADAKDQVMQECSEVMAAFEALPPEWFHDDHRYKNAVTEAARTHLLALNKFRALWDSAGYTNPELSWRSKPMSDLHVERACRLRARYQAAGGAEEQRAAAVELSVLEGLVHPEDLEMRFDLEENTALMLAAKDRDALTARQLLHARCSVHSRNKAGRTPLLVAAQRGATSTVRELLAAGADVAARDRGALGAVMLASRQLHLGCVEALLKAGADADAGDEGGNTPLMLAAVAGHTEMMRRLIDGKATLDLKNADGGVGGTALLLAAKRCNVEAARMLVAAGASLNAQNEAGGSALMWAAMLGHPAVVELLLEAKADTRLKDRGDPSAGRDPQDALQIALTLCPDGNPGKEAVVALLEGAMGARPRERRVSSEPGRPPAGRRFSFDSESTGDRDGGAAAAADHDGGSPGRALLERHVSY